MAPPKCKEKQKAISDGKLTYLTGKQCKYGHASDRYVTTGECVTCYRIKYPGNHPGPKSLEESGIITLRQQAKSNGELTYFTGKPCLRGHLAPRLVSTQCCQQCRIEVYQPNDRNSYRYGNNLLQRQFNTLKNKARRNNIPFTITLDQIERPEYCPVFGVRLNYGWSGEDRLTFDKASFDKVIPALGYIPGNVFIISWRANSLKSNMSLNELRKIMKYIEGKTNE